MEEMALLARERRLSVLLVDADSIAAAMSPGKRSVRDSSVSSNQWESWVSCTHLAMHFFLIEDNSLN